MRTTIPLDDKLVENARRYSGITERSARLREALRALRHREVSRHMILLAGSDSTAEAAQRHA